SLTGSALAKTIASAMRIASERNNRPAALRSRGSSSPAITNGSTAAGLVSVMDDLDRLYRGAVAQIERRERLVLADFDFSLANQFQAGGEGTGDRRLPLLRRREVLDQEPVQL